MSTNVFLNHVGIRLHKDRPKVPPTLNHTKWVEQYLDSFFVMVWFRTRGCRHNHRGGCTMCDYWVSDQVAPEHMLTSLQQALAHLDFEPTILLLNASGSILDNWEVSIEARRLIFSWLANRYPKCAFIFETCADTITEQNIAECTQLLAGHPISIEVGLESADPWVLHYCINKGIDIAQIAQAVRVLKSHGVTSIANILIGAPFLTTAEIVADAVGSVKWAFSQGIDRCVLFPLNIKPWTLIFWLDQQGYYTQPSLWSLIEVLSHLDPQILTRVDISWHKTRPQYHPKYTTENRGPTTCPKCHKTVIALLDAYRFMTNRRECIEQLIDMQCECKNLWREQYQETIFSSPRERVQAGYRAISEGVLGHPCSEKLLTNIPEHTLPTLFIPTTYKESWIEQS